jgi:hypothetical protein
MTSVVPPVIRPAIFAVTGASSGTLSPVPIPVPVLGYRLGTPLGSFALLGSVQHRFQCLGGVRMRSHLSGSRSASALSTRRRMSGGGGPSLRDLAQ